MSEKNEETFVCEVCGREFDSSRGLSLHQRVHDDDKKEEVTKKPQKGMRIIHN